MANEMIEVTDEMIADAKRCSTIECRNCTVPNRFSGECLAILATALEAERAKGLGMWTDAPVTATRAVIAWYGELGEFIYRSTYERDHPNSPARLRAESIIGPKGEKLDGDEWERAVAAVERELG